MLRLHDNMNAGDWILNEKLITHVYPTFSNRRQGLDRGQIQRKPNQEQGLPAWRSHPNSKDSPSLLRAPARTPDTRTAAEPYLPLPAPRSCDPHPRPFCPSTSLASRSPLRPRHQSPGGTHPHRNWSRRRTPLRNRRSRPRRRESSSSRSSRRWQGRGRRCGGGGGGPRMAARARSIGRRFGFLHPLKSPSGIERGIGLHVPLLPMAFAGFRTYGGRARERGWKIPGNGNRLLHYVVPPDLVD